MFDGERERERVYWCSFHNVILFLPFAAGDMEFKQNKYLPVEKQIVTSNPDINAVCIFL